jgi:hypothetical protein
MKLTNKNIFLSTSCINPNFFSYNNSDDRLQELLGTIKSCEKIEDSINIIFEGSQLSETQRRSLDGKCIIFDWNNDSIVQESVRDKQRGTINLMIKGYENIEVPEDSNLFFIAGRYRITDAFDLNNFSGDYVFKKRFKNDSREWLGVQLFKVSGKKIKEFLDILYLAKNYVYSGNDVETSILMSLKNKGIDFVEIDMVHCEGFISGNKNHLELH